VIPVAERTRRRIKALKPVTMDCAAPSGGAWDVGQRPEGMDPERGTDCGEGKTLKGKAHGRSDAYASGGPEVRAAKEVSKPRTWPRSDGGIRR
jgi:hypothetical protein